ncbi:MAG: rhodanese-like domain-containing protein [Chloroflexota bacterium]
MANNTNMPVAVEAVEVEPLLRQGAGVRLIDVRSPAEFESEHIVGSYNVPLGVLPEHRQELRHIGAPIVLVCRSGNRARQAEQLLRDIGLARLHVLVGGLQGWETAGLHLKRGQQRWSLERQVRAIAGGLVLLGTVGSLLVWPPMIFLAMFVGGGLLFAGVTDSCLMGMLLMRLPYNRSATCDVSGVLAELREPQPTGTA